MGNKILSKRKNGNTTVSIFSDGSKIREWPKNEVPKPEFPESIDIKITDYCNAGCPFCFESSTVKGRHADFKNIISILDSCPKGTELAIGGGNPLDHPDLLAILKHAKKRKLISNITINVKHSWCTILDYTKLVYGVGISYEKFLSSNIITLEYRHIFNHIVTHFIAGVHDPSLDIIDYIDRLSNYLPKDGIIRILILGYKVYGRGKKYNKEEVERKIDRLRQFLPRIASNPKVILSFDNLAIKQLRIKEMVSEKIWKDRFLGEDGQFSMYIDCVEDEFAPTSTQPRRSREGRTVKEMFDCCTTFPIRILGPELL